MYFNVKLLSADSSKYLKNESDDDFKKHSHSLARHSIFLPNTPIGWCPLYSVLMCYSCFTSVNIADDQRRASHVSAATDVTQNQLHNTSDVIIEVSENESEMEKTEGKSVVISMDGDVTMENDLQQTPADDDTPTVTFSQTPAKPVENGQVPTSGQNDEKEKEKKEKKRKLKEEIADLDWWSKYYVTKEDLARAERARAKLEKKTRGKFEIFSSLPVPSLYPELSITLDFYSYTMNC